MNIIYTDYHAGNLQAAASPISKLRYFQKPPNNSSKHHTITSIYHVLLVSSSSSPEPHQFLVMVVTKVLHPLPDPIRSLIKLLRHDSGYKCKQQ